jgi:hypothetical protein
MKKPKTRPAITSILLLLFCLPVAAQFSLPPQVPIWDGNTVELKLQQ